MSERRLRRQSRFEFVGAGGGFEHNPVEKVAGLSRKKIAFARIFNEPDNVGRAGRILILGFNVFVHGFFVDIYADAGETGFGKATVQSRDAAAVGQKNVGGVIVAFRNHIAQQVGDGDRERRMFFQHRAPSIEIEHFAGDVKRRV